MLRPLAHRVALAAAFVALPVAEMVLYAMHGATSLGLRTLPWVAFAEISLLCVPYALLGVYTFRESVAEVTRRIPPAEIMTTQLTSREVVEGMFEPYRLYVKKCAAAAFGVSILSAFLDGQIMTGLSRLFDPPLPLLGFGLRSMVVYAVVVLGASIEWRNMLLGSSPLRRAAWIDLATALAICLTLATMLLVVMQLIGFGDLGLVVTLAYFSGVGGMFAALPLLLLRHGLLVRLEAELMEHQWVWRYGEPGVVAIGMTRFGFVRHLLGGDLLRSPRAVAWERRTGRS